MGKRWIGLFPFFSSFLSFIFFPLFYKHVPLFPLRADNPFPPAPSWRGFFTSPRCPPPFFGVGGKEDKNIPGDRRRWGNGGGGAGAQQTAAQLDSFANSTRRGEKGGSGIRGPAWPAPCPAGCRDWGNSEPAATLRPASPPGPSAPRSPPPAPSARTHALANFSPLPGSPLPLRSPNPLPPPLQTPPPAPPPPHTPLGGASVQPGSARTHTHLLQPARPLPGPGARSAGPQAPGASDCAAPGLPGLQRNFPKALPPPQPGSGPTPLPLCEPAGRPGTRPGCARLGVPSPGRPEPHAPAPRAHAADTYG